MYFIIRMSEGGNAYVTEMERDELLLALIPSDGERAELDASKVSASIPDENLMNWARRFIIIKGEIVVPEAVKVETQFKIK